MARPTKLSPEVRERVVNAVRAGNYFEAAARAAGISESTLYRWLERGAEEKRGVYRDFREAVRRAEAESEVHAVAVIRRAMSDDWRAALALIERRHPERWRRRETTEVIGDGDRAARGRRSALDLSRLTDDEIRTLEELIGRASDDD
jgi:transposase